MTCNFLEYKVVDKIRLNPYDKKENRAVDVHIWYPKDSTRSYPIVFFSHKLGDDVNGKSYELCSIISNQGYCVVSISHTYACKPLNDEYRGYSVPLVGLHCEKTLSNVFDGFEIEMNIWVNDTKLVLEDFLDKSRDPNNVLYGKIDINNIGIMGHSLGGSTAISLGKGTSLEKDIEKGVSSINAIINLDGPIYEPIERIDIPTLMIIGSLPRKYDPKSLLRIPTEHDYIQKNIAEGYDYMWREMFDIYFLPSIDKFIVKNPETILMDIGPLPHTIFHKNIPKHVVSEIITFLDANLRRSCAKPLDLNLC